VNFQEFVAKVIYYSIIYLILWNYCDGNNDDKMVKMII
jgi:hypothetical protein